MRWFWRFLRGACTQCGMIPAPTLWRRPRCGFCIADNYLLERLNDQIAYYVAPHRYD